MLGKHPKRLDTAKHPGKTLVQGTSKKAPVPSRCHRMFWKCRFTSTMTMEVIRTQRQCYKRDEKCCKRGDRQYKRTNVSNAAGTLKRASPVPSVRLLRRREGVGHRSPVPPQPLHPARRATDRQSKCQATRTARPKAEYQGGGNKTEIEGLTCCTTAAEDGCKSTSGTE